MVGINPNLKSNLIYKNSGLAQLVRATVLHTVGRERTSHTWNHLITYIKQGLIYFVLILLDILKGYYILDAHILVLHYIHFE